VEQLAAKADVKSRPQAKAAELAGRVKSSIAQARAQAATQAGNVRSQLARSRRLTQDRPARPARPGIGKIRA
jgi:hypothetical protein